MIDIEGRLKEAFDARAATVRPGPNPAAENRYRVHRATRRRRAAMACAAAAAVIAVTVPMAVSGGLPDSHVATNRAADALVKKSGDPADFTGAPAPFEIPTSASGRLTPVALSPDGSFLGRIGQQLWALGPRSIAKEAGVPQKLFSAVAATSRISATTLATTGFGITPRARVFLQRGLGASASLTCSVTPPATTGMAGGVDGIDPTRPVWLDGDHLVYAEPNGGATRLLISCDRASFGQQTGEGGATWFDKAHAIPVALADPTLFYLDSTNLTTLNQVDVNALPPGSGTRHVLDRRFLPAKASDVGRTWVAGATKRTFAWVDGDSLNIVDRTAREPWTPKTIRPIPKMSGTGQLTVGDHVIAYTVTNARGRVGSFIYNMRSGKRITWPGRVYAAGDWLLWQDGGTAKIAKVR
ncbi:hypothetical protein [Actinomadura rupiterrae]|uniref:hypothetical protein n=1 Tax=Actinomadura rupiterrae TaxID=559627 RepID=UPI0020A5819E|nr:hypothetical protein [Actinomadura rupiterrae]MCP2338230.1 hypothetical protein [Actinomadura rupiterrae]